MERCPARFICWILRSDACHDDRIVGVSVSRYPSGWRSSSIQGRSSPTVGWVKVALRKVL